MHANLLFKLIPQIPKGTFINDVPCFLAISDLPTYLVLLYNVPFLGLSWTPLPTLIRDVINERSLTRMRQASRRKTIQSSALRHFKIDTKTLIKC